MKTYYYLYKITNSLNNKIYIGAHQTKTLSDDYMGSGKILKYAKNKYGIENFTKEILKFYSTSKELYEAEAELVNEDFVNDDQTYNIKLGGNGGWDHVKLSNAEYVNSAKVMNKRIKELRDDPNWRRKNSENLSKGQSLSYKNGRMPDPPDWTGKKHSLETKRKIGRTNSKKQLGANNSQFGKMWIHNLDLKESKLIPKVDQIPEGWKKGRKLKF